MGGGASKAGKVSSKLRQQAKDFEIWAWWCHERASQEEAAGNEWSAAAWEARGDIADAEAAAANAAADAAEKAGL